MTIRFLLALALVLVATPVFAGEPVENEKIRVTVVMPDTIRRGEMMDVTVVYENLTDLTVRPRAKVCTPSPFGPLCGPFLSPESLGPNEGTALSALWRTDPSAPAGELAFTIEVRVGRTTLTIPHTLTVVE